LLGGGLSDLGSKKGEKKKRGKWHYFKERITEKSLPILSTRRRAGVKEGPKGIEIRAQKTWPSGRVIGVKKHGDATGWMKQILVAGGCRVSWEKNERYGR